MKDKLGSSGLPPRELEKITRVQEAYFRVYEFRKWLDTNVLFPIVSDAIVHPMRQGLIDAEHRLVAELSDHDALDRVAAVQKNAFSRRVP
jgi:hypothetical protein